MRKELLCCLLASLVVTGCAKPVFMEMDKMTGVTFPPDFVADTSTGASVTLDDIYSADGKARIALDVKKDNTSIPAENTVNNQRLHQLMTANRNPAFSETAKKWTSYQIFVKKYGPNPSVLGIMFDYDGADLDNLPREGSAVFYDAHAASWSGQRLQDELFLTSAHELGHSFNLHHTDWEGTSFSNGSTIMSYSLTPDVLWRISSSSTEHLKRTQNHPNLYVKPRTNAKPFGTITTYHCNNHQATPLELYTCE